MTKTFLEFLKGSDDISSEIKEAIINESDSSLESDPDDTEDFDIPEE